MMLVEAPGAPPPPGAGAPAAITYALVRHGSAPAEDEAAAGAVEAPAGFVPEPITIPVGEPAVTARPLTPTGLGAARRGELRAIDSPQFVRFLRQATMAATKRMPRNSMARFHLALILHRLGDLGRAHVEYQRALECAKSWLVLYPTGETIRQNPRTQAFCAHIADHVVRVAIEMQGDRFGSATTVDAFKDSFRWDPGLPHVWNNLALMHLQAGEAESARIVLETVVAKWPAYLDALSNNALALLYTGRPDSAIRCLQAVLGASRSHVEALNNYAVVLIEEEREPRLAVALLRSSLEWDSAQPAVWANLSVAFARLGMGTEACAAVCRACELAPEWESVWLNAAALLVRAPLAAAAAIEATPSEAAAALAAAAGPGVVLEVSLEADAPAADNAADAASLARSRSCLKPDEVEARIEAQAEILPDARAWSSLAALRMRRWESTPGTEGDDGKRAELRDDCLKASAKALSIDQGGVTAWMQLGTCALHDGYFDKAQGYFLQVLTERPGLVSGWCNLGIAMQLDGRPDEARKAYERGLQLYPRSEQLLNNLGNLHRQTGQWAKAEDCYFRALQSCPGMALAYNNLALLYAATGQEGRAAECLRRALDIDPGLECALMNTKKLEARAAPGSAGAGHGSGGPGRGKYARKPPRGFSEDRAFPGDAYRSSALKRKLGGAGPSPPSLGRRASNAGSDSVDAIDQAGEADDADADPSAEDEDEGEGGEDGDGDGEGSQQGDGSSDSGPATLGRGQRKPTVKRMHHAVF